jgi:hypothetical protein
MKKKATPKELEYWRKVARDSEELDKETSPSTPEQRERIRRILNEVIPSLRLPKRDWLEEEPPELEFYRIAKARGLIRRPAQDD